MVFVANQKAQQLEQPKGTWVAEASALGLRPGHWPEFIVVLRDANEGTLFQRAAAHGVESSITAYDYACQNGQKLLVLNDCVWERRHESMSMTFCATKVALTPDGERFEILPGPDVSLCNRNSSMVLRHLGFEAVATDPSGGTILAEQFRTRMGEALSALRAVPGLDAATASEEGVGEHGARWIDCGLRDGYLQDTLTRLLEVAEATDDNYVTVA